jgi:hypothetical protein
MKNFRRKLRTSLFSLASSSTHQRATESNQQNASGIVPEASTHDTMTPHPEHIATSATLDQTKDIERTDKTIESREQQPAGVPDDSETQLPIHDERSGAKDDEVEGVLNTSEHPIAAKANVIAEFLESSIDNGNCGIATRSQNELRLAIEEFKTHYECFAAKHRLFLATEADVVHAIRTADRQQDIRSAARLFGEEIANVLRITQEKKRLVDTKWTGRLTNFLTKFYPLARLSLSLTSAIAEVRL